MDGKTAENVVRELRTDNGELWRDSRHIATTCFREGITGKLSRESTNGDYADCALVEVRLSEELPEIEMFHGIFEVDELGIWYYDGDGSIDEPIWRQRVIPWKFINGLDLHQCS